MSKRFVQSRLKISQSGLKLRTSPRKRPYHFTKSHSDSSSSKAGPSSMSGSYAQAAKSQGPSGNYRGRGCSGGKDFKPSYERSNSHGPSGNYGEHGHSGVRDFKPSYERSNSYGSSMGSGRYHGLANNNDFSLSPGARRSGGNEINSYHSQKSSSSDSGEYRSIDQSELRKAPACYKNKLPPLRPSETHKVLFRVPSRSWSDSDPLVPPYPNSYQDKWDDDHVHMPCSSSNVISSPQGTPVSRWKIIEDVLKQNITGVFELEEAILSYNQHYANRWSFEALAEFLLQDARKRDEFFTYTLPFIQRLALMLPSLITQPIPILKQGCPMKLTMSQQQAACLLANAFFCTFPKRNARVRSAVIPDINFSNLYRGSAGGNTSRKIEKLKCIVNYFERIRKNMPKGIITFTRHVLLQGSAPMWESYGTKITDLYVSSEGNIEDDGDGMLQADFANKYVGGGVLGNGLVQEEIRFVICPEMIVARLFTKVLRDNEVLFMTGCERFCSYTGYSDTFQYAGDYEDKTRRDSWGRMYTEVVAMDALYFHTSETQYEESKIVREINKAYCAFQGTEFTSHLPAVCTGNWGCGAFKGDKHLKALIQIMAASAAHRQVCYFTFDDKSLQNQLQRVHGMLCEENITVKELYKLINEYSERVMKKRYRHWEASSQTLFAHIASVLGKPLEEAPGGTWNYSDHDFASLDSMKNDGFDFSDDDD